PDPIPNSEVKRLAAKIPLGKIAAAAFFMKENQNETFAGIQLFLILMIDMRLHATIYAVEFHELI
ncbi:MAG: hypothetical protein SOW65_04580, partial [Candidatus Enterosoma sp.]|nr:hypothetical protein [bacterium]MDY3211102.1 hypothetical protein [Candidatus Enterosoma sp.]